MKAINLEHAILRVKELMKSDGELVHTEKWQSLDIKDNPQAKMVEVLHTNLSCPMYHVSNDELVALVKPNMPWAEDHFQERICGYGINPGKEWRNWPWGAYADLHREDKVFNHNYMERYWPKMSGLVNVPTLDAGDFLSKTSGHEAEDTLDGIRGSYGDLSDLINLLADEPLTRQAYLPVWFPEDTGAQNTGRKPCTLGYHFIMRNGKLDITYYIRSCDLFRHFQDDVYLTVRLAQHVLEQCFMKNHQVWGKVTLGTFNMHITSLHMFVSDYQVMFKENPKCV